IEGAVTVRIAVLGAIAEQIRFDLVAGFGEAVLGNVEACDLEPRQNFLHLVEQECLAAADVELARSFVNPKDADKGLPPRLLAPIDHLVPAVAVTAGAVPVI